MDEGGGVVGGNAGVHAFHGHVQHVGVVALLGVVPVGGLGHVIDEGVVGAAGGVHGAGQDLAQGGEAHVAGAAGPDDALDLGEVFAEAQLKGIGAVVDNDDLAEVCAHQLDHVALSVIELQIVGALIPVVVGLAVVGVDLAVGHILGDVVVALAGHAGDHDHRGVGEVLRVFEQCVVIVCGGGLGQIPVLGGDGDRGAVFGIAQVEVDQLLVHFKARVLNTLDQTDLVVEVVQAAGAGAAVDRVGGGPAEEVELLRILQRQHALILQQHEALLGDLGGDGFRLFGEIVGDLGGGLGAAHKAQQCGHGPETDQVCHDQDGQQGRQPTLAADELFLCLGQFLDPDAHGDGRGKHEADGDKVGDQALQYADQVFHFKRNHGFAPLSYDLSAAFWRGCFLYIGNAAQTP